MLMLQGILAKLCHCSKHVLAPYFFFHKKAQVIQITKCKHKSGISVSWGNPQVISTKLKCIVKVLVGVTSSLQLQFKVYM